MIVTEEEAKTKRCQETFGPAPSAMVIPMSQYGAGGQWAYAPPAVMPSNCLGSACMAWQWEGWRYTDSIGQERTMGRQPTGEGISNAARVGYCGKCR